MTMSPQTGSYYAYLLRMWQEQHNGQTVWRASLEGAQHGQQYGFANLHDLFNFLECRTEVNDAGEEVTSCDAAGNLVSDDE